MSSFLHFVSPKSSSKILFYIILSLVSILWIIDVLITFAGTEGFPFTKFYWLKNFNQPTGLYNPNYYQSICTTFSNWIFKLTLKINFLDLENILRIIKISQFLCLLTTVNVFILVLVSKKFRFTPSSISISLGHICFYSLILHLLFTLISSILFFFLYIPQLAIYDPFRPTSTKQISQSTVSPYKLNFNANHTKLNEKTPPWSKNGSRWSWYLLLMNQKILGFAPIINATFLPLFLLLLIIFVRKDLKSLRKWHRLNVKLKGNF